MGKAIMIQGAGSNVGKSMLVAGLCRYYTNQGLKVRPFKPQNMSNNAAVTADGGEIGRAQALQARACKVPASIHMNPVLLKPETDVGAQVIVHGKKLTTAKAREYAKLKPKLLSACLESFHKLKEESDLIIVEGAGSPAEINLRSGDIANMGFAEAANVPVILAGDIDRGGVIAQLVGTKAVLPPEDAARIKAFLINKFRGDVTLFDDGLVAIENMTGWQSLGVVPWFPDAWKLPAEDIMDIASTPRNMNAQFKVAVPRLNRIANFDDLDPLTIDSAFDVQIVPAGTPLPQDADVILIPGSKSTIADLQHIRDQGWDIDIKAHVRQGKKVIGICGGYQMLGTQIADPLGLEGSPNTVEGLGLLNIKTVMRPEKHLSLSHGHDIRSGAKVSGYEIHIGESSGADTQRPWFEIDGKKHGAISQNGNVFGAYLHGMFDSDAFRRVFFKTAPNQKNDFDFQNEIEATLNALSGHLDTNLNGQLREIARKIAI